MHNTVTTNATEMVRAVAVRKTLSVTTRTMFSLVKVRTTAPVKALVVQNAETSSTASEPRYATTSQASGGVSNNARLMRRPNHIGIVAPRSRPAGDLQPGSRPAGDIAPRARLVGDLRGRSFIP